jgi:zinc transport system ATP-binding protein
VPEGPPLIEVRALSFGYRGQPVLEDVDLAIAEHEFLALVGPNGGGKTTLLKLVLGLLRPWSGEVVRRLSGRRGAMGYVPQFSSFDRDFPLRVESMVLMGRLGASGLLRPYRQADRRRVAEVLDQLHLSALARLPIGELSGGQLQRVLIARALAGDPEILLLDEPTASVDPDSREVLGTVLADLNARIPLVVVTHDVSAVSRQVTRVAFVNRRLREVPQAAVHAHGEEDAVGAATAAGVASSAPGAAGVAAGAAAGAGNPAAGAAGLAGRGRAREAGP